LKPDVVVVSLGTNEAFQFGDFDDTTFFDQSLNLVQMLSSLESQPIIVLTTPPAVSKVQYKNKKSYFTPNPLVPRVRAVIMDIGLRLDIPIYDLYTYMGGEDSMKNWAQLGMTDKKRIHFSPKGYQILGEGMRNAIDNHLP
jgi:lysophospholipase L1-like esterase